MEKKTPLYEQHVALGGRMVPFAGYLLPVQYPTGVIAEHMAVRQHAGLFDVSHMGEALIEGPQAEQTLNHILSNQFTGMPIEGARYTLMLNEAGGVIDDLIVYRRSETSFLLVLNAANTEKDLAWLRAHLQGEVALTDLSSCIAQLAIQGPDTNKILAGLTDLKVLPKKYYSFVEHVSVAGVPCMASRTGYTGEDGYELYLEPQNAPVVWEALIRAGAIPCGLGARDTLRLEASMPLYGHELNDHLDPLCAGLGFAVKLGKAEFIGRDALMQLGAPSRVRVGLKVTGRGILREEQPVFWNGNEVGMTTSGTYCPYLGTSCAMAYIDPAHSSPGTAVEVEVRGRRITAEIVPLPFYKRKKST